MLNEQALKNVGPSFEEVGVNTSNEVAPQSLVSFIAPSISWMPITTYSLIPR